MKFRGGSVSSSESESLLLVVVVVFVLFSFFVGVVGFCGAFIQECPTMAHIKIAIYYTIYSMF